MGYVVKFRRYFYDRTQPSSKRRPSSSKTLRYGAVVLPWQAWMQYAVTMTLLPRNKGLLPAFKLHQAWMQLQDHMKGLGSSSMAPASQDGTACGSPLKRKAEATAECAGGAANTLGASSSSSSSQPAALICSAMLHLTSTAAVLTTLIAARQLVASQATEIPHGLQAPSMNQGPAESEALLAAPAAGTGPSTSFAEELVPAALDPSFVPAACAEQLDRFITALQAVQNASPASGLVDDNEQHHILLLAGPLGCIVAPPTTTPSFHHSSSSKKVKRQGAGQEAGGDSAFPVVSLQQPADPWASSAEQPQHHLMGPNPLFAQSTSGGLPEATTADLSQSNAHHHYETAQQQHKGAFCSSCSTGARPAGMECPLTPWAFL